MAVVDVEVVGVVVDDDIGDKGALDDGVAMFVVAFSPFPVVFFFFFLLLFDLVFVVFIIFVDFLWQMTGEANRKFVVGNTISGIIMLLFLFLSLLVVSCLF